MKTSFLERIDREVLVGDGAMGTELYAKGVGLNVCFDELNLSDPDRVASVHRSYVEAGADLLETNTFGADRARLSTFGLESQVRAINEAGVRIARQEAGAGVYVAGSLGPVGSKWGSEGGATADEVVEVYREQVKVLADSGVDLLVFETFTNLNHLLEGLRVARQETKLPVVCQMAFLEGGHTPEGIPVVAMARELEAAGADVIGANCVSGPIRTLEIVGQMARVSQARLSAFPNAGAPMYVNGRYIYGSTPDYMAEYALRMVEAGVSLVGGCCGTTPADIREIVRRLGTDRRIRKRPAPAAVRPVEVRSPAAAGQVPAREKVLSIVRARKFVTVELDPPRGTDCEKVVATARDLAKDGGIDLVNIADNTMGVVRMGNVPLAHILQQETGIESLVHFACRDHNLIGLQSGLMGAWALGIRHILAITGDPAKVGPQPGSSSVYDTQSFGLIELVGKLNSGVNAVGADLGKPTGFSVGVAFDPWGKRMDLALHRLARKVALGAHYALTQPAYDGALAVQMYGKVKALGIPVFLGIMPVVSEKNAEYLHHEVPGIRIPDAVRAQMEGLRGAEGKRKGLELAKALIEETFQAADGFYIIPLFNDREIAGELVHWIRVLAGRKGAPGG